MRFWLAVQLQFLMLPMTGSSARWRNAIQRQESGPWWRWATIRVGKERCFFEPHFWGRFGSADDERRGESACCLYDGSHRTGEDRASAARFWTAALRARSDR